MVATPARIVLWRAEIRQKQEVAAGGKRHDTEESHSGKQLTKPTPAPTPTAGTYSELQVLIELVLR
ncbi:hypothetical protein [Nocardia australiensis]|uniref:hypothetical protein n=1 Tax=Nocardia australiensis TaxID=2887191 RepID=UPI001D151C8C|nr:hypothetical protein [Nocardia australiensis]